MNTLIWYPKCSTCIKAKNILDEMGFEFEIRHIKDEKLNAVELREIIERSGLDIKKFFNTSGLKYRELQLKDKLAEMSYDEKIELLASDGMLVKRPIFLYEDKVVVGKKEKEYEVLK